MFLKKIILPILLGSFSIGFSQEKIASLNYEMEDSKGVSTIVDDEDKKILLLFNDKTKTDVFVLNETYEQIKTISITKDLKEKRQYLGYSKSEQQYYMYWMNSKEKTIEVKKFSLDQAHYTTTEIPFTLEKEILFNYVTVANTFYIFSIVKNTNNINIYCFDKGQMLKKTIDCSHLKFINEKSKYTNFWKLYSENEIEYYNRGIKNINTQTNNSIVLSAQKKKAYVVDKSVILSFDNNPTFNQNLIINLNDFSVTQKVLQYENVELKDEFSHTHYNSFILNDRVFLIKTSEEKLFLTIKDLNNNELKKITYTKTDLGQYLNSDVLQESGKIKSRRVLEKPRQFVDKVHYSTPAVTGVFEDNKYILTIGGVSIPDQKTNAMISGGIAGGGLIGGLIMGAISYASYNHSIDSYANRTVIQLKLVLDENLNHVTDKAEDSNFDKLRMFVEENKSNDYPHIFTVGKNLMYSDYDKKNKTYNLYQF